MDVILVQWSRIYSYAGNEDILEINAGPVHLQDNTIHLRSLLPKPIKVRSLRIRRLSQEQVPLLAFYRGTSFCGRRPDGAAYHEDSLAFLPWPPPSYTRLR